MPSPGAGEADPPSTAIWTKIGVAAARPTRLSSLTAIDPPRPRVRRASSRGIRGQCPPAIAKGREVLNLAEFIVERPEFVADPLDRRADVGSMALLAASGNEARMVHAVI